MKKQISLVRLFLNDYYTKIILFFGIGLSCAPLFFIFLGIKFNNIKDHLLLIATSSFLPFVLLLAVIVRAVIFWYILTYGQKVIGKIDGLALFSRTFQTYAESKKLMCAIKQDEFINYVILRGIEFSFVYNGTTYKRRQFFYSFKVDESILDGTGELYVCFYEKKPSVNFIFSLHL